MTKKVALCVIGTRPEAVKMAPVILRLRKEPWLTTRIIATAQHRHMLDQTLALFHLSPDDDFNVMQPNQSLASLTARLFDAMDECLERERPDIVLAQGDTTTVMVAALTCFYRSIPFCHVEAGLRTGNLYFPFPEEMNRVVAGRIATLHFAPTSSGKESLLAEGIGGDKIEVTGNTVIDALKMVVAMDIPLDLPLIPSKRLILVTAHRRENFGEPLKRIISAIIRLADLFPDIQFLYPVHPNPNVKGPVTQALSGHPRIILSEPLDYGRFVSAMKLATLILSDSGGVQEEAPALAKPTLVLREVTERPEAVEAGAVRLVGTDEKAIIESVTRLLTDKAAYCAMATGISPYGDGHAAQRIVKALRVRFGPRPG